MPPQRLHITLTSPLTSLITTLRQRSGLKGMSSPLIPPPRPFSGSIHSVEAKGGAQGVRLRSWPCGTPQEKGRLTFSIMPSTVRARYITFVSFIIRLKKKKGGDVGLRGSRRPSQRLIINYIDDCARSMPISHRDPLHKQDDRGDRDNTAYCAYRTDCSEYVHNRTP